MSHKALLLTVSSGSHSWNLVYLQMLLEEHGYEALNLGQCTPITAAVHAAATFRPELVVMSSVNGHGFIEAQEYAEELATLPTRNEFALTVGGKLNTKGSLDPSETALLHSAGFDEVYTGDDSVSRFTRRLQRTTALQAA